MVERGGAIVALITGLLMLEKLQQELAGVVGECRYRRRRVRRDRQTKTEGDVCRTMFRKYVDFGN